MRHDEGDGRHDNGDRWNDDNDRWHNDGKVQQGNRRHTTTTGSTTMVMGDTARVTDGMRMDGTTMARSSRVTCSSRR